MIEKNKISTPSESLFVISKKHRYSFRLDTSEPRVALAIQELTGNTRLTAALEQLIGPDPALIEMTVITSTYGAQDQGW